MNRILALMAHVLSTAIAFSIGWILGYVLAPMEDPRPTNITIHTSSTPEDDGTLRRRLSHFHPPGGTTPPVWTADVMRRRGEQV